MRRYEKRNRQRLPALRTNSVYIHTVYWRSDHAFSGSIKVNLRSRKFISSTLSWTDAVSYNGALLIVNFDEVTSYFWAGISLLNKFRGSSVFSFRLQIIVSLV